MKPENTTDEDAHHHTHGVRGLVVGPPTVYRETRVRFPSHTPKIGERFMPPETQTRFGHISRILR